MKRLPWHDKFLDLCLHAQTPYKKFGPKPETLERMRRERRERSEAIALARHAERSAEIAAKFRPKAGTRLADRFIVLMEPGGWYGLDELARAAGVGHQQAGRVHQVFKESLLVTRARNPRWDAKAVLKREAGVELEPKWLWQLTPAGEEEKEKVASVRGDFRDPLDAQKDQSV